jgi:DNA-binding NarL/FixJ family response regulator
LGEPKSPLPFVLEEVFERNGCREPYYQCAGVVIKKKTGEAKTVMAKRTSAETGCSSGPTGEKRTHISLVSGGLATHTAPPCDLCGWCRQPAKPPNTPHGLRIALLDGDAGTRLVARQMVQAQRDGWTLDVYNPSCPVREAASRKGSSRPYALEGDHGPGSRPDIILLGLAGRTDARHACVRKIKALAPALPVLVISGDCDAASIAECCAAGADGYLLKPLAPEELARAVLSAAQGWPVLCREAQKAILNVLHRAATATTVWFPGLTGREQEIAGCLVARWRDKETAEYLRMARGTVHVHLVGLYKKLGVHSRQQAVARLLGVGGGRKVTRFSPIWLVH